MNKKVKLYSLTGCKKCTYIKEALSKITKFQEVICEHDPKACDELEDSYGCEMYPVVEIITESTNKIDTDIHVIYAVDSVKDLEDKYIIRTGEGNIATGPSHEYVTLHRVYSKETLLDIVIKLLH